MSDVIVADDPSVGQILPDSAFGKVLTQLAGQCRYILEIGTWKGQGSTVCLYNGLPPTACLVTLEADEGAWREASKFWRAKKDPRVCCIYGRVVESRDMKPFTSPHPGGATLDDWRYDMNNAHHAPMVMGLIPNGIDLLLLDGGEWSSEAELERLRDRCKFIALDDTNPKFSTKNWACRVDLLKRGWTAFHDELSQRHGWAVFRR